jgi:hypothetical protein
MCADAARFFLTEFVIECNHLREQLPQPETKPVGTVTGRFKAGKSNE